VRQGYAAAGRRTTAAGRRRPDVLAVAHDRDALGDFRDELAGEGIELRVAAVRAPVIALLGRAGLKDGVRIAPSLDAAAIGSELDQDHDHQQ
jgi:hypothetical protein